METTEIFFPVSFLILEINLFYTFKDFKVLSFLIPIYLVYITSELRNNPCILNWQNNAVVKSLECWFRVVVIDLNVQYGELLFLYHFFILEINMLHRSTQILTVVSFQFLFTQLILIQNLEINFEYMVE